MSDSQWQEMPKTFTWHKDIPPVIAHQVKTKSGEVVTGSFQMGGYGGFVDCFIEGNLLRYRKIDLHQITHFRKAA